MQNCRDIGKSIRKITQNQEQWKFQKRKFEIINRSWKKVTFVTGARIAVLLCTETTQKIYRGGAEVDFWGSRGTIIKITAILAPVTKVTFFQERFIISNFLFWNFHCPWFCVIFLIDLPMPLQFCIIFAFDLFTYRVWFNEGFWEIKICSFLERRLRCACCCAVVPYRCRFGFMIISA